MSEDEAFPAKKRGAMVLPEVGGFVYVPSSMKPHLIGGRGTVDSVSGDGAVSRRVLTVMEHPGQSYVWRDIRVAQYGLWKEHGLHTARLPTDEESAALQAKGDAERAGREARIRELELAEEKKWAPRRLVVMNGGIVEAPVYSQHRRARNWAAIVEADPAKPGGLERWWFTRGSGPFLYVIPKELAVHDVVEFGADHVSGSGWRSPERWHGVVLEVSDAHLLIEPCEHVKEALLLSMERKVALAGRG